MTDIDWRSGTWTTAPTDVAIADDGMRVTAVEGSDAWRVTSYGFVHDTEHALLAPIDQDTAMEVAFRLDFTAQFDQAGVFVRVDDRTWTKTGVVDPDAAVTAGPMCCAPSRADLTVHFVTWRTGPADTSLHPDD